MKVVFLHPPLYPVNYQFFNILGKEVELIIYQYGETPSDHKGWTAKALNELCENFEIKVFGKGCDSLWNQLSLKSLKELKKDKPEIVISIAFWIPSLIASLLKNILNFKFIIATDAILATEKDHSMLRNRIRTFIANHTDSFISASQLTSDYLKTFVSAEKIFLSVQTIDVKSWRESFNRLESKKIIREKLGLPTEKKILLGVGNFTSKKNWTAVIKSLKDCNDILFLLIGSGELEEEYSSHIKINQLNDKIKILGRKEGNELMTYFKASDAFIFPSLYDQFGFVVAEALCSDLPVLCTKYSGASSLIKNSVNGYIIDPQNTFDDDISKIMNHLDSLHSNAYKSVQNITLENRAKEFKSIFDKELFR